MLDSWGIRKIAGGREIGAGGPPGAPRMARGRQMEFLRASGPTTGRRGPGPRWRRCLVDMNSRWVGS